MLRALNGQRTDCRWRQAVTTLVPMTARFAETPAVPSKCRILQDSLAPTKVCSKDSFWTDECDENRDNRNGKNKAGEEEDKGWLYWERIYHDPKLRAQLHDNMQFQSEVSMTKLLASEEFIKAQLYFDNVPCIGRNAQRIVRCLLEAECGKNISLFDVTVSGKRWRARFGRCEDALKVQQRFQGYRYRKRVIQVHFEMTSFDRTLADKVEEFEESQDPKRAHGIVIPEEEECIVDRTWSEVEMQCIEAFKRHLALLLKSVSVERTDALRSALIEGSPPFIHDALAIWPIGLLRLASIKARSLREPWEPMSPFVIESDRNLVDYARTLLVKFGPQTAVVDIPWRLFAATLSRCHGYPRDAINLMRYVAEKSVWFVVFKGTIFLASEYRHLRAIASTLKKCA